MFTYDELRKLSPIEPQYAAFKRRVKFRVFLAFAAITYFLFTEKFAWPCEWFLSSFPQLEWSGLTLKEWIVVTILTTIYTSSTSYACFAFLVLNRPAQTNDSVCITNQSVRRNLRKRTITSFCTERFRSAFSAHSER